MKLTFIDNACSLIEADGFRILTDPWLSEGVFEGSWYHYPPLSKGPKELISALPPIDALYISHLHPDHCDFETLKYFDRDIPILLLDGDNAFLPAILQRNGFNRLIRFQPETCQHFGPFMLTMYPPFSSDVFHDARIGNIYDSALVFEWRQYSFFHGNDNNLTPDAARLLRERHGELTLAQLKYNAASPYPACFMNLTEAQRLAESERIIERNLKHLSEVVEILKPCYAMPAAGSFILAGKAGDKNRFLGTCSWDTAAQAIQDQIPGQKTLLLRENQTFDLAREAVTPEDYVPVPWEARHHYVETQLSQVRYAYESQDEAADRIQVKQALPAARQNLWAAQKRYGYFSPHHLYLDLGDVYFHFQMDGEAGELLSKSLQLKLPYLICSMDIRLLWRILTRQAHWNNSEIGCHIDFFREPDHYEPDLHVLLSFLHMRSSLAKVGTA